MATHGWRRTRIANWPPGACYASLSVDLSRNGNSWSLEASRP